MVVATMQNWLDTGASPSGAQATNLRFNLADDNDQDLGNPCVIPTGADNHSYWKAIYLYCSAKNDMTQINNVKIYSDGSLAWTGCTVYVANETPVHNSGATTGYVQATGTSTSGADMSGNYTGVTGKTSLFTYTSGSPKSVTISEASNIINANSETSNYVVLQLTIANTAAPGTMATETCTWLYDEI